MFGERSNGILRKKFIFRVHMTKHQNNLYTDIFAADNALNRFRKMTFSSSKNSDFFSRRLTPAEASTLIVLFDIGEASMNELAKYCGFTNSRITRAMDTLVEQNLAIRYFKPNNRRTVYAAVTPLGAELVSKNNDTVFSRFEELISAIPPEELDKVRSDYLEILDIFEKYCGLYKDAPYKKPTNENAADCNPNKNDPADSL